MDLKELKEFFTTDFNIDHIFACHVTNKTSYKYSCMDVPCRSYGFILQGDFPRLYEIDNGEKIYTEPGDILLLPKGGRYTTTILNYGSAKTVSHYLINFRITDNNGEPVELTSKILKLSSYDEAYKQIFSNIANCYRNRNTMELKSRLYRLFGTLFKPDENSECCITYINQHYTERFSIPELARKCAMSETAYRKRFKELTGHSPIQYINRLKIEKACDMLDWGEFPPSYISDFLSFYSLPYFYKIFKDVTGKTPNEYKNG